MLSATTATTYLTALREGGSLPGLVEASDMGTWVVKFHGAGQGPKVLVAEVIVTELARALDIRVPELKTIDIADHLGRREPDPEIAELLLRSIGTNLAVDFLPGALGFDEGSQAVEGDLAARILWLDAFTANVDRTWRNPNLLVWHGRLWAIDHGAALWFHHRWTDPQRFAAQPFDTAGHVFADAAASVVDARCAGILDHATIAAAVDLVPDVWLAADPTFTTPTDARRAYVEHLIARRATRTAWLPGGTA